MKNEIDSVPVELLQEQEVTSSIEDVEYIEFEDDSFYVTEFQIDFSEIIELIKDDDFPQTDLTEALEYILNFLKISNKSKDLTNDDNVETSNLTIDETDNHQNLLKSCNTYSVLTSDDYVETSNQSTDDCVYSEIENCSETETASEIQSTTENLPFNSPTRLLSNN